MSTPRQSFKTFFCGGGNHKGDGGVLLKSAAISGSLQTSGIRSIGWIYFLGEFQKLAPNELLQAIQLNRDKYQELVQHHIIDPRNSEGKLDPSIDNPLSQAAESPWAKFFQNAELEKLINQDIERCYPDKDFFQSQSVREMMMRLLFIYAKLNPSLSYRQGMHELLAPIIYLLHNERDHPETDPDDAQITLEPSEEKILESLLDLEHLEADAFFIFKHLMDITGDWFAPLPSPSSSSRDANSTAPKKNNDPEAATAVVTKCRRIQHILLKNKDPELHDHLLALKIEPQFYLLRWVRLLFGREFHLDDLVLIWDAIFAHSPDLVLVDYICVAMLVFIREQLLDRDSTGCLTRLMKYPPVEDVRLFIEQAQTLISNRLQQPTTSISSSFSSNASSTASSSTAANASQTPSPHSQHRHPSPSTTEKSSSPSSNSNHHHHHHHATTTSNNNNNVKRSKFRPLSTRTNNAPPPVVSSPPGKALQPWSAASASFKHMLDFDTTTTDVAALQEQVRTLRDTQLAVAQRIDGIVQSIQTTIMANEALSSHADTILLSVAELKQAKDILCGFLPANEYIKSNTSNGNGEVDEEENEIAEIDVNDTPLGGTAL